ncbi:MAG: hypothetical protein PUB11_03430 [Oscillospiraceae bacterium]|nr:hypothetical protein [Oscillospiraceae bacterium]
MRKDYSFQEYHDDRSEFFASYNATKKHKVAFPAFATLVATTAIVATTVLTMQMYVKVSTIAMSPSNAVLNVNVVNEDTDSPLDYFIYKYDKSKTKKDYQNDKDYIKWGTIDCEDTALTVDGLSPSTEYIAVFRATDGRKDPYVGSYLFVTDSTGSPPRQNSMPVVPVGNSGGANSYNSQSSGSSSYQSSDSLQSSRSSRSSQSTRPSSSYIRPSSSAAVVTPPTSQGTASSSTRSSSESRPIEYIAPTLYDEYYELSGDDTTGSYSAYIEARVTTNDGTITATNITIDGGPQSTAEILRPNYTDGFISGMVSGMLKGTEYTITFTADYTLPDGTTGTATKDMNILIDYIKPEILSVKIEKNTDTTLGGPIKVTATFRGNEAKEITPTLYINGNSVQTEEGENADADSTLTAYIPSSEVKIGSTFEATFELGYTMPNSTDGAQAMSMSSDKFTYTVDEPVLTVGSVEMESDGSGVFYTTVMIPITVNNYDVRLGTSDAIDPVINVTSNPEARDLGVEGGLNGDNDGNLRVFVEVYRCIPGSTLTLEVTMPYTVIETGEKKEVTLTKEIKVPDVNLGKSEIVVGDGVLTLTFALDGADKDNVTMTDLTVRHIYQETQEAGSRQITDLYKNGSLNGYKLEIATDGYTFYYVAKMTFEGSNVTLWQTQ